MSSPTVRVAEGDPVAAHGLRRDVLWPERTHGALDDDGQDGVVHLLARRAADDAVIGTLRVSVAPCPWRPGARAPWQLRAMATDPGARGTGAGRALVEAAVQAVRARGGDLLWCDARDGATGFYAKLGFALETEPYEKDGRPHRGMAIAP